ncbi:helix-turn-helix domain-containing protein [Chryseobacterium sp. SIMBA_029]|uniref:helix-turn-helix domain-containing protein n=1 Tax=Chryseobacterium sp. SIMBA_029 TaxID=3085772 RepID=UPI003979FD27
MKTEIKYFLLELIDTGQKTISQVAKESNVPKITIYRWLVYRWLKRKLIKPDCQ